MNSSLRPPDARSTALVSFAVVFAIADRLTGVVDHMQDPVIKKVLQVSLVLFYIALAWKAKPPTETERITMHSMPDITPDALTPRETPWSKKRQ